MVAARERDAFGLRPSDSEEYHQQYESLRHQHPRWESRLSESSLEDLDEPQENELSHGASYLFHSIQGARSPLEHNRSAFDGGVVVEEVSEVILIYEIDDDTNRSFPVWKIIIF